MKPWQTTHTTTTSKPKMIPIQTSTGSTNHHQRTQPLKQFKTLKAEKGQRPNPTLKSSTQEPAHTRDMTEGPVSGGGGGGGAGGVGAGAGAEIGRGRRGVGGGDAGEMVGAVVERGSCDARVLAVGHHAFFFLLPYNKNNNNLKRKEE